jgi:hypothetical protein
MNAFTIYRRKPAHNEFHPAVWQIRDLLPLLFIYLPAFTSPFMDGHPKSMKLMKFFARIFSGRRTRTPFFAEAVSEGIRETLQEMEYHLKMK